jgi:cephalosporin-C deacetylase-like acetyl esterase
MQRKLDQAGSKGRAAQSIGRRWAAGLCVLSVGWGVVGCRMPQAAETNVKQAMEKKTENDWEKFDPRADDLEIEAVGERTTEDGIKLTRLYFTSHKIDGRPVRIYGVYARPAKVKGRVPAILFIHGGGQIADEPEVIGMARHGYPTFSHDWKCSELPEQENHPSKWPFDSQGKRLKADAYHDSAAWIARRALTVLEQQPEVDARHMGVYGFSWGGFHTWTMAATDSRVKAANPSCGVLWSPQPLMANLKAPVLFTDASNDFFARLDAAQKVMEVVNVEHRLLVAPNENHNMAGTGWEATRLMWFDHYLKGGAPLPASPTLSVKTADGITTVSVKAPAATACQLIYSYGTNTALDRCWYGKTMRKTGRSSFAVELPRRVGVDLWYFATADYRDGVNLSTDYAVAKAEAGQAGAALERSRVLYDPTADGGYPWYFSWRGPVADHPWHSWGGTTVGVSPDVAGRAALHVKSGPSGTNTVGVFKAFLRSPGCPLRQGVGAEKLSLDVLGARPVRITVVAHESGNWTVDNKNAFRASVELTAGQGWTTVEVPVTSFKRPEPVSKEGPTMRSFEGVQQFHLTLESADTTRDRPALGTIQWRP